jgi:hypothetical protein
MKMTASDKNVDDLNMAALDTLLGDAQNAPASLPSEAFMTRVLEDALAQQPMPQFVKPTLWQHITSMIGGWQGMGGLVAATCAGFWIGINPPEGLPAQFDTILNLETSVTQLDEGTQDSAIFGLGWDVEEG